MSVKRTLLIAVEKSLAETLAQQFAALETYELRSDDAPWPDAILLDDRSAGVQDRISGLRRRGFPGAIVLIAGGGPPCPSIDATLSRPFRLATLLAVIDDALLRCDARNAPPPDRDALLTEKEAAILARLSRAEGATVSKADLLSEIWGYGPNLTTRTLETHIYRLRRKIEGDPARPRQLVTEAGGYRLARGTEPAPLSATKKTCMTGESRRDENGD